jgi:hypothetical protein
MQKNNSNIGLNDQFKLLMSSEQSNHLVSKYIDSIQREEKNPLPVKKKLSKSTKILYCFILFCVVVGATLFIIDLYFGIGFCIIATLPMIIIFVYAQNDNAIVNIQSLIDPKEFIKQYFKIINANRARHLFFLVAPIGRTNITRSILFEEIKNDEKIYDISLLEGYCKYWKSTFKGPGNNTRVVEIGEIDIAEEHKDKVILNINLHFTSYNSLLTFLVFCGPGVGELAVYFGTKKEVKEIRKTALWVNKKWYVAEGELQGALDFATFKK